MLNRDFKNYLVKLAFLLNLVCHLPILVMDAKLKRSRWKYMSIPRVVIGQKKLLSNFKLINGKNIKTVRE